MNAAMHDAAMAAAMAAPPPDPHLLREHLAALAPWIAATRSQGADPT